MFDIGFSEIIVCCIVALLVIGPERLPETVRTIGLWIGRIKRSLRETRVEIERQIGVDDIRRQLHNEDIMNNIEKARKDIQSAIDQAALSGATYAHEPELPDHAHMHEHDEKHLLENEVKALEPTTTPAINDSALTESTKTP